MEPNEDLRRERLALRSPVHPGEPMSRAELAEAVNAELWRTTGKRYVLDAHTIARYERGAVRWPGAAYRSGLRAVLGVKSDVGLGFRRTRRAADSAIPESSVPPDAWGPDGSLLSSREEWAADDARTVAALLAGDRRLPVTDHVARQLVHQWLVADSPQRLELRAGRRVGRALVDRLTRRVDLLRRLDDVLAGRDLSMVVERELRDTAAVLGEGAYTDEIGRQLYRATAELAQLAGWVNADAGQPERAARQLVAGVHAAHAAGDRAVAANLISTLSYQVANTGDPGSAVLLARSAAAGVGERRSTPLVRALLLERVAWACAKLGDRRGAERTLRTVEELHARERSADEPEWVYWLDETEVTVMAGRCFVELGDPERAIPLLAGALASYDLQHSREAALYISWLAEAHLAAGDVDEAARLAGRALGLAVSTGSARADQRVELLRRRLASYGSVPAVTDFLEMAGEQWL